MTSIAIVATLILIVGIAALVFDKALANRFAKDFLKAFWWILPAQVRQEKYFVTAYRIFFYAFSIFAFFLVVLALLGIAHNNIQ